MLVGYPSVTWAPGRWWRSLWWKSSSHSWSRPRTDFHLSRRPEPRGPAACFRQQDHYSWGRRCCACAHSPSHCQLREAAGRWRRSLHFPYGEYLMTAKDRNKLHLQLIYAEHSLHCVLSIYSLRSGNKCNCKIRREFVWLVVDNFRNFGSRGRLEQKAVKLNLDLWNKQIVSVKTGKRIHWEFNLLDQQKFHICYHCWLMLMLHFFFINITAWILWKISQRCSVWTFEFSNILHSVFRMSPSVTKTQHH